MCNNIQGQISLVNPCYSYMDKWNDNIIKMWITSGLAMAGHFHSIILRSHKPKRHVSLYIYAVSFGCSLWGTSLGVVHACIDVHTKSQVGV